MKWLRGLLCMPIILLLFVRFKITNLHGNFWEHSFSTINTKKYRCLAKWLLISALTDKNPDRIASLYLKLRNENSDLRLSKRTAIAVFESAIWIKNEEVAKSLLAMLGNIAPSLSKRGSKRLELLYLWRFSKSISDVIGLDGLLSPLMPDEAVLTYVYYFAKATIADSTGKLDDALRYYQESLRTVPQNSSEYRYAMERCNALLNTTTR